LTLRIKTIRRERTERHGTTQTGQENGEVRLKRNPVNYSFMLPARAIRESAAASHFARVWAGSIT
jgi:hypothetical protein